VEEVRLIGSVAEHVTPRNLVKLTSRVEKLYGATSCVYYGGYVFFEKLRIKEAKPKSKHRTDMEEIYSHKGGMDLERDGSKKGYVSCFSLFFVFSFCGLSTFPRLFARAVNITMPEVHHSAATYPRAWMLMASAFSS
jgi:hypothetical protein